MLVIATENNLGIARLGLAISRKNVKTATKRNQIKRIIRESFRINQQNLEGLDIVVTAHRASVEAEKRALKNSISNHWQRITECKNY
jgi:ribonuclease P protein component